MSSNPSEQLADGTTIVTADGVAARQIEIYLAQQHLVEGRTAWSAPTVLSYRAWIKTLCAHNPNIDNQQLLSPGQVRRLWRQIVENSEVADRLIGSRNVVQWAIEAAQRLRDWEIDVSRLCARDDDLDFASFLDWSRMYAKVLAKAGWLDPGEAEVALRTHVKGVRKDAGLLIWADFDPMPAQAKLREQLRRYGHRLQSWNPSNINETCHRILLAEINNEIRAAGRWAAEKLSKNPDHRIGIVIPDLRSRREEVRRILSEVLNPKQSYLGDKTAPGFINLGGEPPIQEPLIGSALTALELFSSRGRFGTFSRWLRSPFFITQTQETETRARLEIDLRALVSAQLRFLDAMQAGGLTSRIQSNSPALAATLTEAVRLVGGEAERATLGHWIDVWRRLLRHLGWLGDSVSSLALSAWESALNEVVLLTPVAGEISYTEALSELRSSLTQPQYVGPTPLSGVFVMDRLENIGPGYDGIWVAGLTDSRWPQPDQPNPILPLELQRAHGMPLSSPTTALEHSQRATLRLIAQGREVILSYPRLLDEHPTQPSPLIQQYPEVTERELLREPDPRVSRQLFTSKSRQSVDDKVPPLPDRQLRGGARTLTLQASCPLRAFLESRLTASPLEIVCRGLSAKHRGIAVHRATELLFLQLPKQSEVGQWGSRGLETRIGDSVEQALQEIFGSSRNFLKALFRLEAERLYFVLSEFLVRELERAEFEVSAIEERLSIQIGELNLRCRVDRVDSVGTENLDPRVAIIDYKTGSSSPTDWLRDRPRDVQLPLYTLAIGDAVTAVVIAELHSDGIRYKGLWPRGMFPGRPTRLPEGRTWTMQLNLWRKQLEVLAQEFADGDGRIFESEKKHAEGVFAPLTRIYEQAALVKGLLDQWRP
jgi:ATP-dependent helicase/nuclease subunit B